MRVGREHGLRVVAKPSGDDVHGDAVGQRQVAAVWRRMCSVPDSIPAAVRWRRNHSVSRCGWIEPPSSSAKTRSVLVDVACKLAL